MDTRVLFEVSAKNFPWPRIWAAAGTFAIGVVILVVKKFQGKRDLSRWWGYFFIVCGLLMAGDTCVRWYASRQNDLQALASRHYEVVQGSVDDFHPMPEDGSSNESFVVSGHTFSYSDYDESKLPECFDKTAPHGGPIHPGMLLRIKYVNQCILEIDALPERAEGRTANR